MLNLDLRTVLIFILTMNKCSYPTPLGAKIVANVYASELADKCPLPESNFILNVVHGRTSEV